MTQHSDFYGDHQEQITITIETSDRKWTLVGNADECLGAQISYALSLLETLGFKRGEYVHDGAEGPWND